MLLLFHKFQKVLFGENFLIMDDFSIVVSQSSKSHRVATFQSINPSIFFYSPFEMVSSVLIVTRLPLLNTFPPCCSIKEFFLLIVYMFEDI